MRICFCFISKLIQRPPWHFLLFPATPRFPSFCCAPKAARKPWDRLRDPWWLGKAGDQPALEVNPTCSCRACLEMGHALPEPHKPGLTVLQSMVESPWSFSSTNTCVATKGIVAAFLINQEQKRNKNWRSDNCTSECLRTCFSHSFSKFMLDTQEYFLKNAEKIFRPQPSVHLVYWKCLTDSSIISFWFDCESLAMLPLLEILFVP